MTTTRRAFCRHAVMAGPLTMVFWFEVNEAFGQDPECTLPTAQQAKEFVPNEPKIATRFSTSELARPEMAEQLKKFRQAIKVIQNLDANDVVGWKKQTAQHCIQCAPGNLNNIHFNWQFLPWHRGLLYFFERTLRTLSKNDDLRLPYWDWDASSRQAPQIYTEDNQPLYRKNRTFTGPEWPLSDDSVNVQPLLALPSFPDFGGTASQGEPTPAVFSGPHANVHNAFFPGDMSDLRFSPRDPLFYAHHANLDRLWSSWVEAGHKNSDFRDAKVYFYDETRTWRFITMNNLHNEAKLGYKYSSLMKPKVSPTVLSRLPLSRTASGLRVASASLERLTEPNGPRYLLIQNARNLERLPTGTLRYGVFAGKPNTGTVAGGVDNYLGTISRVTSKGHDHVGPLSGALEVTGKLRAILTNNKGNLNLNVAPLDAVGKTTAPSIPLVADNVSIIG